jgi:prevent-host-death family protein
MERIPAEELKSRLHEILQRVASGEHFTITNHGKEAAELAPIGDERAATARHAALETILDIQKRVKPLGIPVRDAIEDGRM